MASAVAERKINTAKLDEIKARVMSERHPDVMELSNPLAKQRQAKRKRTSRTSVRPDDLKVWTTRDLASYFAERFRETTGKAYRIAWAADQATFQKLGGFFASSCLPKITTCKDAIDWMFDNYDYLVNNKYAIMPQTLNDKLANIFLQDVILARVEEGAIEREETDVSLLNEIKEAEREGKRREVFIRHGFPVAFTYLCRVGGMQCDEVTKVFKQVLSNMRTTIEGRKQIELMVTRSILGSPYPAEFEMLNWREVFSEFVEPYKLANWWRAEDYRGKPMPKYRAFLEAEEPNAQ